MIFWLKDYRLQEQERRRVCTVDKVLRQYNIVGPGPHSHRTSEESDLFDSKKRKTLSTLVWEHGYSLVELVELVRSQTPYDRRPNKVLCPQHYGVLLKGYRHQRLLQSIPAEGILPLWHSSVPHQCRPPPNHHSTNRHLAAVAASIRKGQDAGQYLVLDEDFASLWPHVQVSPFGAVPKKDVNPSIEARLIHDLSFPKGRSTNDASDKTSFPNAQYTAVAAVARRIYECVRRHPGVRICIAKGDVKGAFRHLMLASKTVCWMGGRLPEQHALIIDMSATFGWSGSPPFYSAFGGVISWLVGNEIPESLSGGAIRDREPFFPYEWVDDHVLVEADSPGRLVAALTVLRLAVLAVLDPRSINEKTFSEWTTHAKVLGLEFDTKNKTVSMPTAKILKAQCRVDALVDRKNVSRHELECLLGSLRHVSRVDALVDRKNVSRHELECLLGSLRHVSTRLRSARPFFQTVASGM